jgi:hypothetical protein
MSYCRFQNTLGDLQDCEEALDDGAELSKEEEQAKAELIKLCKRIVSDYGDES